MQRVLNDSRLGRFTVAILAAGLAVVLQQVLVPVAGPAALWLCFVGGVIIGAWYGGLKPGLITTLVLTTSAIWLNETELPVSADPSAERWASALD